MDGIVDTAVLRAHFGAISPMAERKVLPRLDRHAKAFIALSPFLVLATADAEGRADASPRGDAPGFVAVLDDTTLLVPDLLVPDRPGNNRVDTFGNVLSHPGVGMIFLVPGIDETLRVNGKARLVTDSALLGPAEVQGKVPRTGLVVAVEEVFFHCGKALKRSHLWDASRHVERKSFPSLGRIIIEQTGGGEAEVAVADTRLEEAYRTRLY